MASVPRTAVCSACGKETSNRVFGFNSGNREYAQPLVSQSLAMSPEQIGEHQRLFPDVQVTPDGCPVFTNFSQHEAYLKRIGFQKLPGKRKAKSHRNVTRITASEIKQELQERKANA
jgi:hypothetical protein